MIRSHAMIPPRRRLAAMALGLIGAWITAGGEAHAAVLVDETSLVAVPGVAAPSQYSFTESTAEALTLTLTDFVSPAAFSSLSVAVTLGNTLVGQVAVDPATHTANVAIPAAVGDYTVYVIGAPDATQGIGSFGVCVALAGAGACTSGNQIAAYSNSGILFTPATPSSTPSSTLNTNFTSTVAGTYSVTITDDAFPVALQQVAGTITLNSNPIQPPLAAGLTQVTLAAKTQYQLIIGAAADATVKAGLYGVHITAPNGAVVFDRTLPVGLMPASTVVDNKAAGALDLSLTDLDYPAALASAGVAVTQGSVSIGKLTAPGTLPTGKAAAGSLEIWRWVAAGAQPGVYTLDLTGAAGTVYSTTQVAGSTVTPAQSFAFVATLPAAGTYNLKVADFQFPATLQSLSAEVGQGGVTLSQDAKGNFTAAKGTLIVVVDASPPANGNGIFGVTVQTTGNSPQTVLDTSQAVGGVFTSQPLVLGTSGSFTVALADLGFPGTFQDLAAVVSRGGQVLGSIVGGGSFPFAGTPGQYVLTFVATPSSPPQGQGYGLYSLEVAATAPSVTLSANPGTVTAGATTTLTWSSQNAASCSASGGPGWAGSQATSGSLAVAVSASETLTLTCAGPGGSASQSVTVTATAAPASGGGGGGGRLDPGLLIGLATLAWLSRGRRRGVNVI